MRPRICVITTRSKALTRSAMHSVTHVHALRAARLDWWMTRMSGGAALMILHASAPENSYSFHNRLAVYLASPILLIGEFNA